MDPVILPSIETPTLTKADLAELLFERLGLNKRESKDMVEAFFEIIHDTLTARGLAHEKKTQTVLLLIVASFVVAITAWLPPLILQDEYNKLAA